MMEIQFQGATGTVTGSRFKVKTLTDSFLIDCGLFQGPKEIRQKNWTSFSDLGMIREILLTHAHVDHSGLIPLIHKKGFRGPIYCSGATFELCKIMLPDSGRLQEEDAKFLNEKKLSHFNPALPLYTEKDATESLKLFSPIDDNEWHQVGNDPSVLFRLQRSSHILGSRFVELGTECGRFLFSGDLGQPKSLLLKDRAIINETDCLILESTYGDRGHAKIDRKKILQEIILKIHSRGGTLIIPSFAVGRAQEIIFLINQLENEKQIPAVPVYLDSPMALDATEIYAKFSEEIRPELQMNEVASPIRSLKFKAIRDSEESLLLCMDTSPKIIISAAGMLNGGRVLHHLKAKLPDPKSGVLFIGYQAPGTKGALLRDGLRTIRIHHQLVDVEAEVFNLDALSSHADSDQTVNWCRQFRSPPERVFLVHGEDNARRALAYRLKTELNWNVTIPFENEIVKFQKTRY